MILKCDCCGLSALEAIDDSIAWGVAPGWFVFGGFAQPEFHRRCLGLMKSAREISKVEGTFKSRQGRSRGSVHGIIIAWHLTLY